VRAFGDPQISVYLAQHRSLINRLLSMWSEIGTVFGPSLIGGNHQIPAHKRERGGVARFHYAP
jgi:hypothetical protein